MIHTGHGGMSGMSDMAMYFHGGYTETILFEFWKIDSVGGLIGSMIGCFLLAIMYEGLKFYRDHLFRKNFRTMTATTGGYVRPDSHTLDGEENAPSSADAVSITPSVRAVETSMWSLGHFNLTLMHLIQVTLSYLLMLIFMTYNSWLCAATVFGAAVGYFLFGWRKTIVYEESGKRRVSVCS
jgi:copper transporter 1